MDISIIDRILWQLPGIVRFSSVLPMRAYSGVPYFYVPDVSCFGPVSDIVSRMGGNMVT